MDCQFKRQARFNPSNQSLIMDKIANALFLTEKETEFLGHILNDAWYQIDQDNLTDEGLEIFKSIEKKIKELNNA